MIAPIRKLLRAVKEKGWEGTLLQLYTVGDLKFGTLKGIDKFNNKYYEDLSEPFGQHRWIEYADIHNYDASMIQPEWHGWMHHMYDETPDQFTQKLSPNKSTVTNHTLYNHHYGQIGEHVEAKASVNLSQYRSRGYKVGSLMTGENEPDHYYRQPGHPLSNNDNNDSGRFKDIKNVEVFNPTDDASVAGQLEHLKKRS